MDSDNIEIVDFSGEKFHSFTIPCSIVIFFISILIILIVTFTFLIPGAFITTFLSLVIIFIFIVYYYNLATKASGKLRKFTISDSGIEILIPRQPVFLISWFEIDKIEVRLKKLDVNPYVFYQFLFIRNDSEKKITLSLNDFHKEKIYEILICLKEFARIKKKIFSAVKETNVSGVVLVEDLKI